MQLEPSKNLKSKNTKKKLYKTRLKNYYNGEIENKQTNLFII